MVYSPQRMYRVLLPITLAYQAGSRVNNFLFDHGLRRTRRTSLPVISVGNIAFGGSGKTPLVMHLLSFLLGHGLKPALVTRGYKGGWERTGGVLSDGKTSYGTWQDAGDEPFMVYRNFPQVGIYVGRNRWISCERAEKQGFDIVILDDGFQHRSLHRDLDIVLFDPEERVTREPLSSLKRADMVLLKRPDHLEAKDRIQSLLSKTKVFFYSIINKGFLRYPEDTSVPKQKIEEKRLLAFCGIARPERFFSLLEKEGLTPLFSLSFPDHHSYPEATKNKIIDNCQRIEADAIITTEKDVFKLGDLKGFEQFPVYYNRIDLQVEGPFYRDVLSVKKTG
jgi:tetraacyldisaccharide 4'-kinase